MREILCLVLGVVLAMLFIKSTGSLVHFGNQDYLCYIVNNPLNR